MKTASLVAVCVLSACARTGTESPAAAAAPASASVPAYLDYSGRDEVLTGGVKLTPIQTPRGTFRIWTKRVGNSPRIKVLLLHGGPGATHEYFEAFDSFFPAASVEY